MNIQLNLAHVARKNIKKETKTNKRQCPFNSVHVICEGSPEGIRVTKQERICEREELEWKVEGVKDGEGEGGDCDEMICAGWGEPGRGWG